MKETATQAAETTKSRAQGAADDVATHGQRAAKQVRGTAQTAKAKTTTPARARSGTSPHGETTASRPRTSRAKASDVHVAHRDGSWVVEQQGTGVISTHRTQALAEQAGRRRARLDKAAFVLHAADGRVLAQDSYGNDPRGRG